MFHVEQFIDLLLPGVDKNLVVQRLSFLKEEYFKWNKIINISSIRDEKGFWEKHVVDSLCLAGFIFKSDLRQHYIYDIGSGGGFPGLVLSSVLGNKIMMVDPVKKKTDFLKHVVLRLGLKQAEVYNGVFEDIVKVPELSMVVSRALGNYKELYEHFKSLNPDISVFVMATDKQDVGVKGVPLKDEYDIINPLLNDALKGHILLKLN